MLVNNTCGYSTIELFILQRSILNDVLKLPGCGHYLSAHTVRATIRHAFSSKQGPSTLTVPMTMTAVTLFKALAAEKFV